MRSGIKTLWILLGFFLLLWLGLRFLLPLLFPFLLGLGLALAAEPLVVFLVRKLRLPRSLAAGFGVTAAFCGIALLVVLFCALVIRELGVLAGILPDLADTAQAGLTTLQVWLMELTARMPGSIRTILQENVNILFSDGSALVSRIFRYGFGLAGGLLTHVPDSALTLGTALISGFMFSAKLPRLRKWVKLRFPLEKLRPLLQALKRLKGAVGGWLLAQLKLAGVTLAILLAGLLLLRIPYAPLWALGISLVDAFPVLGTGTVLLPWALISFLQGDTARAVGLAGIYAVITLVRSVLEPKLVGKHLGLDPLVTLMVFYAGYKLWGIPGMILAPLVTVTAMQLVPRQEG